MAGSSSAMMRGTPSRGGAALRHGLQDQEGSGLPSASAASIARAMGEGDTRGKGAARPSLPGTQHVGTLWRSAGEVTAPPWFPGSSWAIRARLHAIALAGRRGCGRVPTSFSNLATTDDGRRFARWGAAARTRLQPPTLPTASSPRRTVPFRPRASWSSSSAPSAMWCCRSARSRRSAAIIRTPRSPC